MRKNAARCSRVPILTEGGCVELDICIEVVKFIHASLRMRDSRSHGDRSLKRHGAVESAAMYEVPASLVLVDIL